MKVLTNIPFVSTVYFANLVWNLHKVYQKTYQELLKSCEELLKDPLRYLHASSTPFKNNCRPNNSTTISFPNAPLVDCKQAKRVNYGLTGYWPTEGRCSIRTLHAFRLDWFYQKSIIKVNSINKKKALLGCEPSSAFFLLLQRHWKNRVFAEPSLFMRRQKLTDAASSFGATKTRFCCVRSLVV